MASFDYIESNLEKTNHQPLGMFLAHICERENIPFVLVSPVSMHDKSVYALAVYARARSWPVYDGKMPFEILEYNELPYQRKIDRTSFWQGLHDVVYRDMFIDKNK